MTRAGPLNDRTAGWKGPEGKCNTACPITSNWKVALTLTKLFLDANQHVSGLHEGSGQRCDIPGIINHSVTLAIEHETKQELSSRIWKWVPRSIDNPCPQSALNSNSRWILTLNFKIWDYKNIYLPLRWEEHLLEGNSRLETKDSLNEVT